MANPQKEDGHVDIANEIVEALAKIHLSSYESQILWVIFRKTYGWHKKEDWITNTQIANMTEIAESHVSRTIKILIQKNIIIRSGKKLAFQKDYDRWKKLPKGVTSHHKKKLPKGVCEVTKGGNKSYQRGYVKLPKGVDTKETTTKETTTKETIQKVRNQVSASLKEKTEKRKANDIEFDQELLSWHGIDEDIYDDWIKRFPNIDVPVELMNIREYFKNNPRKAKDIEKKFEGRMPIYINDWLERAEKYRIIDKE